MSDRTIVLIELSGLPVSNNHLYEYRRKYRRLTNEARLWKDYVTFTTRQQAGGVDTALLSRQPFYCHMEFFVPARKFLQRDVTNMEKATLDAIMDALNATASEGEYIDDRYCVRYTAIKHSSATEEGYMTVLLSFGENEYATS